jgi:hypothetical protein
MVGKRFVCALVLLACLGTLGGCARLLGIEKSVNSMAALPETLADVGKATVQMMADQGVMDTFTANAEGDFLNPGIRLSSCIKIESDARLIGVTGSIGSNVQGTGTQLPKDVRAALIGQLPNASDEQRAAILTTLGWNRSESPHNPVPDGGGG